jgi:hypothetical protein
VGSGAPNKDNIQNEEPTQIYQHTYDEVLQAAQDAIGRRGMFVTATDKDKGTISGNGSHVPKGGTAVQEWTFDIHIEALNTKPETRVKIDCEWKGHSHSGAREKIVEAHFRETSRARCRRCCPPITSVMAA